MSQEATEAKRNRQFSQALVSHAKGEPLVDEQLDLLLKFTPIEIDARLQLIERAVVAKQHHPQQLPVLLAPLGIDTSDLPERF